MTAASRPRPVAHHAARTRARTRGEVAIEDSKQLSGTGQARNRTAAAVERTLPFMLACQAAAVCWYATAGHHPADAGARAPWYTTKTEPSAADMTAELRRVIIAAKFMRSYADQAKPAELHAIKRKYSEMASLPTSRTAPTSANANRLTGLPNTYIKLAREDALDLAA